MTESMRTFFKKKENVIVFILALIFFINITLFFLFSDPTICYVGKSSTYYPFAPEGTTGEADILRQESEVKPVSYRRYLKAGFIESEEISNSKNARVITHIKLNLFLGFHTDLEPREVQISVAGQTWTFKLDEPITEILIREQPYNVWKINYASSVQTFLSPKRGISIAFYPNIWPIEILVGTDFPSSIIITYREAWIDSSVPYTAHIVLTSLLTLTLLLFHWLGYGDTKLRSSILSTILVGLFGILMFHFGLSFTLFRIIALDVLGLASITAVYKIIRPKKVIKKRDLDLLFKELEGIHSFIEYQLTVQTPTDFPIETPIYDSMRNNLVLDETLSPDRVVSLTGCYGAIKRFSNKVVENFRPRGSSVFPFSDEITDNLDLIERELSELKKLREKKPKKRV